MKEYCLDFELNIHSLVVDAWPPASATFLHSLTTVVLHILRRGHFSDSRCTGRSIRHSIGDKKPPALLFENDRGFQQECSPNLGLNVHFLVVDARRPISSAWATFLHILTF